MCLWVNWLALEQILTWMIWKGAVSRLLPAPVCLKSQSCSQPTSFRAPKQSRRCVLYSVAWSTLPQKWNCTSQRCGSQLWSVRLADLHSHSSPSFLNSLVVIQTISSGVFSSVRHNFWCKIILYSTFMSCNSNMMHSAALAIVYGNKEYINTDLSTHGYKWPQWRRPLAYLMAWALHAANAEA